MSISYLEIKDGQRTAWFASEDIRNIADAAALLNRAINMASNPDIATIEQCAAGGLHPITKAEFDAGAQELTSALRDGLIAQVDLANDRGTFSNCYWKNPKGVVYKIHSPVSRLSGLYEIAYDKAHQELNEDKFIEGLVHHCSWEQLPSPAEIFSTPEQSPPQQGMTM